MTYKPYDKSLENYDVFGRKIVKDYIIKNYKNILHIEDNSDTYGVDFLIFKKDKLAAYGEVEVRSSWKSKKFPFNDLNVPTRKYKFFNYELPTYFFSINESGTAMFICTGEVIRNCEKQKSPNKYLTDEYFFKVPLKYLQYVDLENN